MRTFTMLVLFLLSTPASAESWGEEMEGRVSGLATWASGIAIGDSHDFAERYGFFGFNGEVLYHATPELSIGVTSGYQLFRGKGRETAEFENATLTAYQFRFLDTAPILAVARYYVALGEDASFFPALGIGTMYTNREVDVGYTGIHSDTWHFALAPQLGVVWHTYGPDPLIAVKYNWAVGGGDSPTEMWFTVELGTMFE